jgi:hypothetical protein
LGVMSMLEAAMASWSMERRKAGCTQRFLRLCTEIVFEPLYLRVCGVKVSFVSLSSRFRLKR